MKKFLMFLCFVFVTFALAFVLFKKTDLLQNIVSNVEIISSSFASDDLEEYNSYFYVNTLAKLKYNTYYYDKLNNEQKKIYTAIANSVKNLENAAIVKIDKEYNFENISEDVKKVMESFFSDHPEVFYLNTEYQILTNSSLLGNSVKVYLSYSVESMAQLEEKIEEMNTGISEYTKNVLEDDTEYQKELKIHDNIATSVEYYNYSNIDSIPETYHTAYSGVSQKAAVCDGFTKLYQLALNEVGISSILVTGTLEQDPHAWNMVEIDGNWYNVDLTSNKTIKEKKEAVVHAYFNVTSEYIKRSHTFSDENLIPEANSEEYNYYKLEDKTIKSSENFNNKLEKILKENKNEILVEFLVDDTISEVPEKIVRRLSYRDYKEYINEKDSTIQYYKVLNNYIILKN